MASLFEQAKAFGFHLSEEYIQSESARIESDGVSYRDFASLQKALLLSDLRKLLTPFFPASLAAAQASEMVVGKAVLQIVSIVNIALPSKRKFEESSGRLLAVTLTDGHSKVVGIEMEHLSDLHANTPPGGKVLYSGGPAVRGRLLLTRANLRYLGGEVSFLLDAHQANITALRFRAMADPKRKEKTVKKEVSKKGQGPLRFTLLALSPPPPPAPPAPSSKPSTGGISSKASPSDSKATSQQRPSKKGKDRDSAVKALHPEKSTSQETLERQEGKDNTQHREKDRERAKEAANAPPKQRQHRKAQQQAQSSDDHLNSQESSCGQKGMLKSEEGENRLTEGLSSLARPGRGLRGGGQKGRGGGGRGGGALEVSGLANQLHEQLSLQPSESVSALKGGRDNGARRGRSAGRLKGGRGGDFPSHVPPPPPPESAITVLANPLPPSAPVENSSGKPDRDARRGGRGRGRGRDGSGEKVEPARKLDASHARNLILAALPSTIQADDQVTPAQPNSQGRNPSGRGGGEGRGRSRGGRSSATDPISKI
eukprot:gene7606-8406_t